MTEIQLNDNLIIGKGRDRVCYQHPDDKELCIKISVTTDKQSKREKKYFKYLGQQNCDLSKISTYQGMVNTDLGQGYLFQLVRDIDGPVSKTLKQHLTDGTLEYKQVNQAVDELRHYLKKNRICVRDISPSNIVYQKLTDGFKLVIIDGVSNANVNPLTIRCAALTNKANKKSWTSFDRKIRYILTALKPSDSFQPFPQQKFLITRNDSCVQPEHYGMSKILSDRAPSLVGVEKDSGRILKFVRSRTWHEYVKLLWNHSRISKEVNGNYKLRNLGLKTPDIYTVGLGILPSRNHEFLGFYMMENLTDQGFREASELFRKNSLTADQRNAVMQKVYQGWLAMKNSNIVFSDFHLDNVLVNESGELAWIDTGITEYAGMRKSKFRKKFNHALKRFVNYYPEDETMINTAEKTLFLQLLID